MISVLSTDQGHLFLSIQHYPTIDQKQKYLTAVLFAENWLPLPILPTEITNICTACRKLIAIANIANTANRDNLHLYCLQKLFAIANITNRDN